MKAITKIKINIANQNIFLATLAEDSKLFTFIFKIIFKIIFKLYNLIINIYIILYDLT